MHIALVAVALNTSIAAQPSRAAAVMTTYAIPAIVAPVIDPPLVELAVATEIEAPRVETATEEASGAAGCNVTDDIRAALVASPLTRGALAVIPPDARTVANAVMLWDGGWASLPPQAGGIGLAQLRKIVVSGLLAVPADCRVAAVGGPRLIFVPDGATTVVLAFGSGTWAWSELLG